MSKKTIYQVVLPLITAFIWGSSFVSQSLASGSVGTFFFNAARSLIASIELLALALVLRKLHPSGRSAEEERAYRRELLRGALLCGTVFTVAANLQQFGIESNTSSGKAGFITALYIVIVPILGFLLLHQKVGRFVWLAVALALVGLYLLCFEPGTSLRFTNGDLYIFLCAVFFSVHILAIDHFTKRVDGVELSCAQFIVQMVLCLILGLLFDHSTRFSAIVAATPYILYVGVLSSGVGYTLQILAQKEGDPTIVSLLLSFEAFFAAVSGAVILHERLSLRETVGCAVMLVAVFLAQIPDHSTKQVIKGDEKSHAD